MNLEIVEIGTTEKSTGSQLFIDRRPFCFIIEDGYRDIKIPGVTRIPSCRCQIIKRTHGRKYEEYKKRFGHKFAIEIFGVPNFSDILLHIGCFVKDTNGCPLVNKCIGIGSDGSYYGMESTVVYKVLYALIEKAFERGEEVWIDIIRNEVIDENTPVG